MRLRGKIPFHVDSTMKEGMNQRLLRWNLQTCVFHSDPHTLSLHVSGHAAGRTNGRSTRTQETNLSNPVARLVESHNAVLSISHKYRRRPLAKAILYQVKLNVYRMRQQFWLLQRYVSFPWKNQTAVAIVYRQLALGKIPLACVVAIWDLLKPTPHACCVETDSAKTLLVSGPVSGGANPVMMKTAH